MKHKPAQEFPQSIKIKDEAMQVFGKELGEIFIKNMRNIYDDLKFLDTVEGVSALPTASKTTRGKLYLLLGTGGSADILYIGIDTGSGGYAFKTVTIT